MGLVRNRVSVGLALVLLLPLVGCSDDRRVLDQQSIEPVAAAPLDPARPIAEVAAAPAPPASPPLSPPSAAPQPAAANRDWLRFRGPDGRGHAAPDAKPPLRWSDDENVHWVADLPGPGTSSPVVFGNRIYLTCQTGYGLGESNPGQMNDLKRHLLAFAAATGDPLWAKAVAADLPETEFGRRIVAHGYASSTPAVDADRIYTFFGKSGVVAFSHDGAVLWQTRVGSKTHEWGSAASPVLFDNLVIVNAFVECGQLVALDKATGKEVWRAGRLEESWNTPLLVDLPNGQTELVVAISGKILGFDPATGAELWSCEGHRWYIVGSMVAHGDVVFCLSGKGVEATKAVRAGGRGDVTQTHTLWHARKGSNVSSPLYHDGHLYFAHEQLGVVYCLNAETGAVVYEERLPRPGMFYASPVLAGGHLYYVARQEGTYVLTAQPSFQMVAHNRLASDRSVFNGSPAVVGNRLYLRSDRKLYCLGAE